MEKAALVQPILDAQRQTAERLAELAAKEAQRQSLLGVYAKATEASGRLLDHFKAPVDHTEYHSDSHGLFSPRKTPLIPLGEVDPQDPHGQTHAFAEVRTWHRLNETHTPVKTRRFGKASVLQTEVTVDGAISFVSVTVYAGDEAGEATHAFGTVCKTPRPELFTPACSSDAEQLRGWTNDTQDVLDVITLLASEAGVLDV